MYALDFDIQIGAYQLLTVERVVVESSQALLSDRCTIELPGMVAGKTLNIEERIKVGDPVRVQLGYNGELQEEFVGYVRSISPDSPAKIECEDAVLYFRQAITPKVLVNTSVRAILTYVLDEVKKQSGKAFRLVSPLKPSDFVFDRFAISQTTGLDVLENVRRESGLRIYIKGDALYCHLAFGGEAGQRVIYDMGINVEDVNSLKYVQKEGRRVEVVVVGRTPEGARLEARAGESGGSVIELDRPTVTNLESARQIAEAELRRHSYEGYTGSLRAWLVPYCTTGYSAVVRDPDWPAREGRYYVEGVKVEYLSSGGVREVELGMKL